MALPNKNSSAIAQLQGLVDLLLDLQIVDQGKEPSEESFASNEEATSQNGAIASGSGEEDRDLDSESNQQIQPQLNEEQPKDTEFQSTLVAEDLAPDEALAAVESVQNPQLPSQLQDEKIEETATSHSPVSEANGIQGENLTIAPEEESSQLFPSPRQAEKIEESTTSQSLLSEPEFNSAENLTLPAEEESSQLFPSPRQVEKIEESTTNQSLLSEPEFNSAENLTLPAEEESSQLFPSPRQVEKIEESTTNQSLLSEPEFNSAENLTVAAEAESSQLFPSPRQVEKIEESTTSQSLISEPEFNSAENLSVAEEAESSLLFPSPRQVEQLEEATTNQSSLSNTEFNSAENLTLPAEAESSLLFPSPRQAEKIEEATTNQSLLSEPDFNSAENLSVAAEAESSLLFPSPPQGEKIEEATTNQSFLSNTELNSAENLSVAAEAESSLLFPSPQQAEKIEEATTKQSLLSKPDFKQAETEPEFSLLLPSRLPAEKIEDSTTNYSLLSKAQFNPVENLTLPPQPESSLEFFSKLSEKPIEDFTIKSSASADNPDDNSELEDVIDPLERLQRLLLTPELMDSREAIVNLTKKLATIEHQIYDPSELINLLLPLITQILSRKISEAREDVARAIAPIVDEMIQAKTQQDKVAVSSALAPVLPDAVAKRVSDYPGEFAKALGPEMGTAIKEQISLERDAMVDALYPVIGSTISKYMAEVVNSINEKVESTLSIEGISRKIRARMQGVSEAELILKEAMPFTIQAIFLIHKGSGLVISEVQELATERLESEMIAGMLTAIRSFVNDCIAQSGGTSEIDQIEYGQSKIILEVAGYCYMAAVIQGDSPKPFIRKMRNALAIIVQRHGKAIELFDGDPANVPEDVHQIIEGLTKLSKTSNEEQKRKPPTTLLLIGVGVFSAIFLPWGIYQYRSGINRQIEEKTSLALASDPELAVYRLSVEADGGTLMLSGKLPNQYLRAKAEQIAKSVEPELKLDNAIIAVKVPADPVLTAAEVQRVTAILNQMEGVAIWASYRDGKVTVEGTMLQVADAQKISRAFEQIPGVQSVSNTVQLQDKAIASRIYFDLASSQIKSEERSKVTQIEALLDEYPNKRLKLTGYSDRTGLATENQRLALERAKAVRDALVAQGIDSERLDVAGNSNLPSGIEAAQPSWLSRCVEFEIITP